MGEKYIKPVVTRQAFQSTYVHLLFLLQLSHYSPLDVEQEALLVVACLAVAGVYEMTISSMANGALRVWVIDVEEDFGGLWW